MKSTPTLTNVFVILLVITGIIMRIYNLPDEQLSLIVSLFGILIYILAAPEHQEQPYQQSEHSLENF